MCGRFALFADEEAIKVHFGLKRGFHMKPRYNIAPMTTIPVVRGKEQLDFMQWGFIPKWAKASAGKPSSYMNARIEGIEERPVFKSAFKSQRCLIPASGYYEWKEIKEKKQPYFIQVQGTPIIALAGIWDSWLDDQHQRIDTVALLTLEAKPELKAVHERMPLICDPNHYQAWLNPKTSPEDLKSLLTFPSLTYELWPVSTKVNHPRFDDPACIRSL